MFVTIMFTIIVIISIVNIVITMLKTSKVETYEWLAGGGDKLCGREHPFWQRPQRGIQRDAGGHARFIQCTMHTTYYYIYFILLHIAIHHFILLYSTIYYFIYLLSLGVVVAVAVAVAVAVVVVVVVVVVAFVARLV